MADLSAGQRAALSGLLAKCSTSLLVQVDAMAASMSGPKPAALRALAAAEVRNRERRDRVLAPLDPLFKLRPGTLPGLSFPPQVRARVWAQAIRHEPGLLVDLDRGDQVSRIVADRLCLSAAMGVRDHPEAVWSGADEGQIADLAAVWIWSACCGVIWSIWRTGSEAGQRPRRWP